MEKTINDQQSTINDQQSTIKIQHSTSVGQKWLFWGLNKIDSLHANIVAGDGGRGRSAAMEL